VQNNVAEFNNKNSNNYCSKNFDERPHRRGRICLRGKVYVTPATLEQCNRLQQSRWCRCWFFAACTAAVTQGFSVGRIIPKIVLFLWGIWTPSNTWFLRPTRVYPYFGISIDSAVSAGLTNVTNRHTDTQTDHATPSSVAIDRI